MHCMVASSIPCKISLCADRAHACAGDSHVSSGIDVACPTTQSVFAIASPHELHGDSWPSSSTGTRSFCCNQQYSITAVTTSTGSIAERYAYSSYGQPTVLDASASVLSSSAINNRYTYTGREWDATLGLHHFRARWMSPIAGRFLGRDPIGFEGSGSLLYDFLRGDTLEKLDPSGLIPITCECQCAYGKANQNSPDGSGRWLFYTTVNCNGLAATCCSNACNNLNCRDVLIDYGRCGGKKVVRQCDNCVFTGHWRAPGHPFTPSTGDCSIPDCVIGCNFSAALAYALCRRYASESICRFAIGVATTQCIVSCFRRCKDPCSWIAPGIQPCYW